MKKFKFFDKEGYLITLSSSKVASCERTATSYEMWCQIGPTSKLEKIEITPKVFSQLRRVGLFKGDNFYTTLTRGNNLCIINLDYVVLDFNPSDNVKVKLGEGSYEAVEGPELTNSRYKIIHEKIIDQMNNIQE